MLSVLDRKWREHLYEMDYLKEGIGLRAMAQRDPLVEYQREGYDMFSAMMDGVREETVAFLFNVKVQANQQQAAMAGPSAAQAAAIGDRSVEGKALLAVPGGDEGRPRSSAQRRRAGTKWMAMTGAAQRPAPAGSESRSRDVKGGFASSVANKGQTKEGRKQLIAVLDWISE